jgi:hypothetical protein
MKTKLTLSVEKDLIQYARQQAKHRGQTVSGMFAEFLRRGQERAKRQAAPRVTTMVGSLKGYQIDDTKQTIRAAYAHKHLD